MCFKFAGDGVHVWRVRGGAHLGAHHRRRPRRRPVHQRRRGLRARPRQAAGVAGVGARRHPGPAQDAGAATAAGAARPPLLHRRPQPGPHRQGQVRLLRVHRPPLLRLRRLRRQDMAGPHPRPRRRRRRRRRRRPGAPHRARLLLRQHAPPDAQGGRRGGGGDGVLRQLLLPGGGGGERRRGGRRRHRRRGAHRPGREGEARRRRGAVGGGRVRGGPLRADLHLRLPLRLRLDAARLPRRRLWLGHAVARRAVLLPPVHGRRRHRRAAGAQARRARHDHVRRGGALAGVQGPDERLRRRQLATHAYTIISCTLVNYINYSNYNPY